MLVDKQNDLMSDLLFTVHQHGGDDVKKKPPIKPPISQYSSQDFEPGLDAGLDNFSLFRHFHVLQVP